MDGSGIKSAYCTAIYRWQVCACHSHSRGVETGRPFGLAGFQPSHAPGSERDCNSME